MSRQRLIGQRRIGRNMIHPKASRRIGSQSFLINVDALCEIAILIHRPTVPIHCKVKVARRISGHCNKPSSLEWENVEAGPTSPSVGRNGSNLKKGTNNVQPKIAMCTGTHLVSTDRQRRANDAQPRICKQQRSESKALIFKVYLVIQCHPTKRQIDVLST